MGGRDRPPQSLTAVDLTNHDRVDGLLAATRPLVSYHVCAPTTFAGGG
jgi:hypothetical protein